ncbi:hypothetical protein IAR55_005622 [Kwoniella newhampshirensis]|uniref:Velvet domain-containing protein n=1 Tax=Kwoniella newhampshirensis TaxID=1651941 RepID=A0AAW0YUJ1_9TREE
MCSHIPFYLPPPPPGYQLIYVPPPPLALLPVPSVPNPSTYNGRPSPYEPNDDDGNHTHRLNSRSSTPDLSNLNLLPTPSTTPSSHCRDDSSLPIDHDCILRKYEMVIRQQPVQARMCGVGEKSDRRPVDPTPIIQLKVIDGNGDDVTPGDEGSRSLCRPNPGPNEMTFMQNPYYFLFACLVGGSDDQDDELHVIDDGKTRFLTGTPVSSLYHLKDLDNTDAAFFVFPDLGVRKEGRYKLKLTLFEIVDQEVFYCTTMFTSAFSVFSAKKFPGMSKATDLSKSFADQGLKIRVRKDPRQPARSLKVKRKSSANESEDDASSQLKRSRGMSLGQTQESDSRYRRDSHGAALESDHQGEPRHYQFEVPPNGYHHHLQHPGGWYPSPGHHMPPPPPPAAFDPYRSGPSPHHPQQHVGPPPPHYPPPPGPGYPTAHPQAHNPYHGSSPGRPQSHPGPTRQYHPAPPPRYVPPEQSVSTAGQHQSYPPPPFTSWQHQTQMQQQQQRQQQQQQQQQSLHHHPEQQYMHAPPMNPHALYERGPASVPWPQPQATDHRTGSGASHSRHPSTSRIQPATPTHPPPPLPRGESASRPPSPRIKSSRTSPRSTNALQISGHGPVQRSPTSSVTSTAYRPSSSSGRREHQLSPVVLAPLSMGASSRPGSRGGRGALPSIVTDSADERDREEKQNRSAGGSHRGSVAGSPASTPGTSKTNRMGLGHLVD